MTTYKAIINSSSFYTYIVRVDTNGEEYVLRGYASRHFASMKAAEKSTTNYIAKFCS